MASKHRAEHPSMGTLIERQQTLSGYLTWALVCVRCLRLSACNKASEKISATAAAAAARLCSSVADSDHDRAAQ